MRSRLAVRYYDGDWTIPHYAVVVLDGNGDYLEEATGKMHDTRESCEKERRDLSEPHEVCPK